MCVEDGFSQTQSHMICGEHYQQGIGGSVVEFLPATREARVRFPANAVLLTFCSYFYHAWCFTDVLTAKPDGLKFINKISSVSLPIS